MSKVLLSLSLKLQIKSIKKRVSGKLSTMGGSRTAPTSKMERFVIIGNGWKPLTVITKCSILDAATVLDPPLQIPLNKTSQSIELVFSIKQHYSLLKISHEHNSNILALI